MGRRISGKKGPGSKEAVRGNLIGARDLKLHAKARKAWNKGFNPTAIKGHEPILIRRVAQLVESLRAQRPEVFGGGFELMHDGDKDGLWHKMEHGLYLPTLTQQMPWSYRLSPIFPDALAKFALDQAKRWLQEGSVHNDLFYYRIDDKRTDTEPYLFPLVVANSVLAIIAGSDTSATVLANTFFFLLSHPESYKRLQLELDEAFPGEVKEPTDAALSSSLPYLNAVIKESLRLLPLVATSLQRAPTVGTRDKVLGEDFIITEGTSVVVPPYTMHRDTRYFSLSPDKYLPERWLGGDDATGTKFVVNEDARLNCDLRRGTTRNGGRMSLKDYFVMQKGSLPVVVTSRCV
ncbi:cytochrome P450 [Mycena olivaceomarginata]|nr:cytochrome P450 [Mycena olivaceomarginata]